MDDFVDYYVEELKSQGVEFPDDFRQHFDMIWLDYARIIVTGLWKNLSHDQIKRYQNVVGPSMINKSLDHIHFIIERIIKKLPIVSDI